MSQLKFADKDFYKPVFDFMKENGFEFLAWVTINTKQVKTYVNSLAAQDSRLFFHLPGKSMIIMLSYSEYYYNEKSIFSEEIQPGLWYWAHWSGEIWFNFDHVKMWGDLYENACKTKDFMNVEVEDINLPNHREMFSGDKQFLASGQCGYGMQFFEAHNSNFSLEEALKAFSWIAKTYNNYFYRKFDELGVGGFSPEYAFPGCNKYFWDKFPFHRLYSKVKDNIYGHKE